MVDKSWRDSAVCASVDPELFFPETGQSPVAAKKICASCPVQPECLESALWLDNVHGVWGGTTRIERQQLRNPLSTRRTRVRAEAIAVVLRLHDQGLLARHIAERVDVNERTVYRIIRKARSEDQGDRNVS